MQTFFFQKLNVYTYKGQRWTEGERKQTLAKFKKVLSLQS